MAILLITTVVPVTFSENTQPEANNQEFQAAQAELVNFLMHLNQTLDDFDEYSFDEELLAKLQVEIDLAFTVAGRSTTIATIEYSLGFLRVAYSALLEDSIINEIEDIQLLFERFNELNEENFTPLAWDALQEKLENVTDIVNDSVQALNDLGIELDNDLDEDSDTDGDFGDGSDEDSEDNLDENFEVSVRDLPDLTEELEEIFKTLVEVHEILNSSYDALEVSVGAGYTSDEAETDNELIDNTNNEVSSIPQIVDNNLEEPGVIYCPRTDDECLAALFQVARFELLDLLLDHDTQQELDPLAFEYATQILIGNDLEKMLEEIESLLDFLSTTGS